MATVSIHIEGHGDGQLDDLPDLALVLRYIADQMMNEQPGYRENPIPTDVLKPYVGWDNDEDVDPAEWSVQHSRY